ncbi:uncharacterized protein PFLUO_LOCUS3500 [Penicillium psychrofluorescens]|uniref:uncharacterized protein n=1 Tax=Penicillium psychrofluorescens TaxID=3158075 RepID=UPI003CCD7097
MARQASTLHQRGQKLYQKCDFKAAIEAFSEALNQKNGDTIGVLDNRAATYSKLEQLDQARRDAKQMIKLGKNNDERGYLRCAKVLLLEGKADKALEIYAYGLKMLPADHPRRSFLQQLHDKLYDKMFVNRRDPFTALPLEVAFEILKCFSFKQVVAILRVSKTWERFFTSMPNLWMNMDLSGARGKVPWTALRAYIRRSKARITHATIKNLATASISKSLEILSRCPQLEYLELGVTYDYREFYKKFQGCKRLKTLIVSADMLVTQEYFGKFINAFPHLERIALLNVKHSPRHVHDGKWPSSLPNLKSITLAGKTQQPPGQDHEYPIYIPSLSEDLEPHTYPNLEELRLNWNPPNLDPYFFTQLSRGGALPPLRRLSLTGVSIGESFYADLPTTIEYLYLEGGMYSNFGTDDTGKTLPNLHTLMLVDLKWLTSHTLNAFLVQAQAPVQTLHVTDCVHLTGQEFLHVMKNAAPDVKLTELSIFHMFNVDDTVARYLHTHLPDLKILNLSFTNITGCSIRMFADARASDSREGARLERLRVQGCEEVSSDAVAYGRERGLEIITR